MSIINANTKFIYYMTLKIKLLHPNSPNSHDSEAVSRAYRSWIQVWQEEYSKIKPGQITFSDNFTRQDAAVAVFIDGECAALTLFNNLNLTSEMGRADSFFSAWPNNLIYNLQHDSPRVLGWSAFSIPKSFRRLTVLNLPLRDLAVAAGVYYFQNHTNFETMLVATRNSRNVNSLLCKYGGRSLETVEFNNEPSDLICFRRSQLSIAYENVLKIIKDAWHEDENPIERRVA